MLFHLHELVNLNLKHKSVRTRARRGCEPARSVHAQWSGGENVSRTDADQDSNSSRQSTNDMEPSRPVLSQCSSSLACSHGRNVIRNSGVRNIGSECNHAIRAVQRRAHIRVMVANSENPFELKCMHSRH